MTRGMFEINALLSWEKSCFIIELSQENRSLVKYFLINANLHIMIYYKVWVIHLPLFEGGPVLLPGFAIIW